MSSLVQGKVWRGFCFAKKRKERKKISTKREGRVSPLRSRGHSRSKSWDLDCIEAGHKEKTTAYPYGGRGEGGFGTKSGKGGFTLTQGIRIFSNVDKRAPDTEGERSS